MDLAYLPFLAAMLALLTVLAVLAIASTAMGRGYRMNAKTSAIQISLEPPEANETKRKRRR